MKTRKHRNAGARHESIQAFWSAPAADEGRDVTLEQITFRVRIRWVGKRSRSGRQAPKNRFSSLFI